MLAMAFEANAAIDPAKVIIIKADDFRVPTTEWTNFLSSSRTLLNYTFQPPDVTSDGKITDVSVNARHGTFTQLGIGTYTYTADSPAALASWHSQSLNLFQNATDGGARLICGLSGSSVINFKTANWTAAAWVKRANTTDQDIVFHLGANLGNSNGTTPTPDFTLTFNGGANTLSLKNYSSASLSSTPDVNITTTVSADLQSTTDLSNPLLWEAMTAYSNIVATNQTVTLTPPMNESRSFYRLRITVE
jgi:hypothetical protein